MGLGSSDEKRSSKCTPARVKNCLKTFLVHLFSHVGLCVLVVGYAVIGGFIFREIEDQSEEDEKLEAELADATLNATRRQHVSNLWVITDRLNVLYESNWTLEVEAELEKFERAVRDRKIQETRENGKWTFTSALLYSVSIITTIGYGKLVPKTLAGKMFTMLYAVIGVPIMLLWVSNIGNVMAHAFKFAYFHAPCRGGSSASGRTGSDKKSIQSRPSSKEKSKLENSGLPPPPSSSSGDNGPVGLPTQIEFSLCSEKCATVLLEEPNHSPRSSSSRSPSTPTKRSHGPGKKSLRELDPTARRILFECAEYNLSEGDERSRELLQQLALGEGEDEVDDAGSEVESVIEIVSASSGHRRFSGGSTVMIPPPPTFDGGAEYPEVVEGCKQAYGFPPKRSESRRVSSVIESLQVPHGTPSRVPLLSDRDVIDIEIEPSQGPPPPDTYSNNLNEKRVPVSLVLLVVVLYILLGAAVFKAQEGWPFWDSVYFCFITLSTIGLGDITPGKSLEHSGTRESTVRLVFCCFYLVIGLAIIAMSFNLVQEQVTIKVTEFARRVGIIEDEYS